MTDTVALPATAPPIEVAFCELLRSYRERTGLTQRALADLSTISPRAIRDLESGRARARTRTIHLLADGLRLQGLTRDLFIHAGLSGRRETTPGPAAAVPRPLNALLGRDGEVRAMVEVLESGRRRMISISGLPGVGKTRLAAEVAARLASRQGWPVLWIGPDLHGGDGRDAAMAPLIRSVRSLIAAGAGDVSRVWQLLGRHEALMVLDAAADLAVPAGAEELLAYCPGLRMISTARSPWHVPGVQAAVISPLATPPPEWDASADALAAVPSVRLFLDRLAEVRPGFPLGPADLAAAAEICRRLDGLPLALEVVAGRFRVLSLCQLAEVPVPALLDLAVPADSSGRRQTIGGLLGACVAGLGAGHRAALRELAAIERPWTAPAAAAVLHRSLDSTVDALHVLIGRGLVRAVPSEPGTELHVPNLLRVFLRRNPHSWG